MGAALILAAPARRYLKKRSFEPGLKTMISLGLLFGFISGTAAGSHPQPTDRDSDRRRRAYLHFQSGAGVAEPVTRARPDDTPRQQFYHAAESYSVAC